MLMTSDSPERRQRRRRVFIIVVIVVLLSRCSISLYNIFFRRLTTEPLRIDIALINEGLFYTKKNLYDRYKRPQFLSIICPIIIHHDVLSKDYNITIEYTRINQWWRFSHFLSLVLYHTRRWLTSNIYVYCLSILLLYNHLEDDHS